MKAMVLMKPDTPLVLTEVPEPHIHPNDVLLKVRACGVCRTDLHIRDGELAQAIYPRIPGHEVVGEVVAKGKAVSQWNIGDRVGATWLGRSCGACRFCKSNRENLCDFAMFNGCHLNGGYAEYMAVDERYCYKLDDAYNDVEAAPLLCAGLIGYRAFRFAGDSLHVGLFGFGAAAHMLTQLAINSGKSIYAFTRPDDKASQQLAISLGATWAGSSLDISPRKLDAAIIFAPAGELVPAALGTLDKGGIVICAGIHMSNIPEFPYAMLWEERRICSVANLTREDAREFMAQCSQHRIYPRTTTYSLEDANQALDDLRAGRIHGAAVLTL